MATINGTDASETLDGTENDDTINGLGGDDTLIGNTGNDILYDVTGKNVFYGDDGDDTITSRSDASIYGGNGNDKITSFGDALIIDGGADDDLIQVYASGTRTSKLTGGTGRDTFEFHHISSFSAIEIIDFTPGAAGDILNLDDLLANLSYAGYSGNPFGTGQLRLLQSGPDTLLQYDYDGPLNGEQFQTLLTLKNVTASNLTKENFDGFPPDGSVAPGQVINGTTIVVPLPDGGSTIIDVADTLTGTVGDDIINGLGGDDTLRGRYGSDIIEGGTGDDYINGEIGDDTLIGGDGDDIIASFADTSIIDGGDGNDIIVFYGSGPNADKITGGTGRDTFRPSGWGYTTSEITDFTPGATGDIIRLDSLPTFSKSGYSGNPFATGHLRLRQSGPDTLLQYDPDGLSNGAQFVTVLTLKNVTASTLTKENFDGYLPLINPQITGSGNDTLNSVSGIDALVGGAGNDKYYVNDQGDVVLEYDDQGMDEVYASVSYILSDNIENLILTGTGGLNGTGNSGNNFLKGNDGNNILEGGEGDDSIYGGLGRDTASYEHAAIGVSVNLGLSGRQDTGAGADLLNSIENLTARNTTTRSKAITAIMFLMGAKATTPLRAAKARTTCWAVMATIPPPMTRRPQASRLI